MKNKLKSLSKILLLSTILLAIPTTLFAHSGRTDSSGGHKDKNNVSGLGSYHYHCGRHPAHLHEGEFVHTVVCNHLQLQNQKAKLLQMLIQVQQQKQKVHLLPQIDPQIKRLKLKK